jgi:hypothetical protein
VSNRADAEFVFGEDSWVERNLVPISKSPSCFQTHRLHAATPIKSFQLRFRRDVKTIRQTHFDLLGEQIIRRSMAEPLTLKKFAEEKRPWRQHIGIYRIGKTAARKHRWRTVGTWYPLLGRDDDWLLCCGLREDGLITGGKCEGCPRDQRNEPAPPSFAEEEGVSHKFRG